MRVACALVTHLRAKVEMSRHPDLKDSPVLIVDRDVARAKALVVDRFPGASGVAAGMTLEQAMSRHANAVALDADEPHYRRVFSRLLTALQGVGDRVEGPSSAQPTSASTGWKQCIEARPGSSPLC